jgi:hypothetical protein
MSPKAAAFVAANKKSPVVSGGAKGRGGEGGYYTLKSGKTFNLTADECRDVGMPRWDLPA